MLIQKKQTNRETWRISEGFRAYNILLTLGGQIHSSGMLWLRIGFIYWIYRCYLAGMWYVGQILDLQPTKNITFSGEASICLSVLQYIIIYSTNKIEKTRLNTLVNCGANFANCWVFHCFQFHQCNCYKNVPLRHTSTVIINAQCQHWLAGTAVQSNDPAFAWRKRMAGWSEICGNYSHCLGQNIKNILWWICIYIERDILCIFFSGTLLTHGICEMDAVWSIFLLFCLSNS